MDREAKRKALRMITHGVTVCGVKGKLGINAFTLTWLTQCSFNPPLVALGVEHGSASHKMLEENPVFTINFLAKNQKELASHFIKPAHNPGEKLQGVPHTLGSNTGCPLLNDAIAWVECKVSQIVRGGDHDIVVGEVVEAGCRKEEPALALSDTGWFYGG